MTVATLQYNILWEDTLGNLDRLNVLLQDLEADIVILPEMFNTGFTMNPENVAEENGGNVLLWMKSLATKLATVLIGSVPVSVNGKYYNRLYWVEPDGKVIHYDKRHLFRMAGEDQKYTAGSQQVVVDYKGFKFMLQVCYDLRFPVWSRNVSSSESAPYDCLIYVANWPEVRSEAWFSLLKARAIENLAYVIGVNRVGEDGNGIIYDGRSAVFDFKGVQIDQHVNHQEGFSYQILDLKALQNFRTKFPAFLDADRFVISNQKTD